MTDLEYRKILQSLPYIVWFIGAIIIAIFTTILAFYMLKPSPQTHTVTPKTNFAIVSSYKGCDVVQWSDGNQATYKYFLHCNNTRPVYGAK